MRLIKFRAWDTKRNKMWSTEEMGKDQLTISPDGRGFVNVSGIDIRLSKYYVFLIPEQFTGLLDKNGVEIFEGDIIKHSLGIGKVIYDYCTFFISRFDISEGWPPNMFGDCEIIGNIHQHPELLK